MNGPIQSELICQYSRFGRAFSYFIVRLSAKGTAGDMKRGAFAGNEDLTYCPRESSVHYRNRGGEWRGCIAATPYVYMVRPPVKASTNGAVKLPANVSLSNRLDFAGWPVPAELPQDCVWGEQMAFKILRNNCCGLDIHKTWILACIGITDSNGRIRVQTGLLFFVF